MKHSAVKLLTVTLFLGIYSSSSIAGCPPGMRYEGGTGGRDGEEFCFGTPTASKKQASKKPIRVRKAQKPRKVARKSNAVHQMNGSNRCKWSAWACGE